MATECPICYENKECKYTECNHVFCLECLCKLSKCAMCIKELNRPKICQKIRNDHHIQEGIINGNNNTRISVTRFRVTYRRHTNFVFINSYL